MMRLAVLAIAILCVCALGIAQSAAPAGVSAVNYAEHIQVLEKDAQEQAAVFAQQAETDPSKREELEKQIVALKHRTEQKRLEILLAWAESEGDQNKIAEIKRALDHWRNPVAPPKPSSVPRPAPQSAGTDSELNDSSR